LNLLKRPFNNKKNNKTQSCEIIYFKLQSGQVGRNTLFITGSSNLTSSGITTQEEFNVEISDYGFNDAEEYFDIYGKMQLKSRRIVFVKNDL